MGRVKADHFFLLGISYKTAPVEIRERISFDTNACGPVLGELRTIEGIEEAVLISTCNRTEFYAFIDGSRDEITRRVADFIVRETGIDRSLLDYFYIKSGTAVIEHLFRVAAGLDSMVLGEPQIFGQVKNAFAQACDTKSTGPTLNRLFHHAFRVGKLIRNSTGIGEGAVSVSFAAVELAKKTFGELKGYSILLIGAGKTSELSAKRLVDIGVSRLFIANRTETRARELADRLGGVVVPYDSFPDMLETVDIVIASVAAAKPVLTRDYSAPHIEKRASKRLLVIDLGVPRNVESTIGDIENVTLFNIDNLEGLTLDNMDKRREEAEKADEIIDAAVEEYCTWLSEREVIPVIRTLHDTCETIRAEELEKVRNRVDAETFETIDLVTRRIVRKLLHNPVITMREAESGDRRERLLESVRELFIRDNE